MQWRRGNMGHCPVSQQLKALIIKAWHYSDAINGKWIGQQLIYSNPPTPPMLSLGEPLVLIDLCFLCLTGSNINPGYTTSTWPSEFTTDFIDSPVWGQPRRHTDTGPLVSVTRAQGAFHRWFFSQVLDLPNLVFCGHRVPMCWWAEDHPWLCLALLH